MSVHYESGREPKPYVVRWREAGRHRTKRFATENEALAYEQSRVHGGGLSVGDAGDEVAVLRAQLARLEARLDESPDQRAT